MHGAPLRPRSSRGLGLLLGVLADEVLADPRRGHPVAGFGRVAAALERRAYADSRAAGLAFAAVLVALPWLAGRSVERAAARRPGAHLAVTAVATWIVVGATSLRREGLAMAAALERCDLGAARRRLPHLCGRDPAHLDRAGLARATVESVAENTSDAAVAPLLWGAVAGVPGLLAYRAVNTLDAMVGHRSPRYARFGWASARLDDVANFGPARLTGALACLLAPVVGGSPVAAWRVLRRDGAAHPSPNSGRCEAAFAGALGLRLGGVNRYGERVEHRPLLGDGTAAAVHDPRRAALLSHAVTLAAAALSALLAALPWPGRR